MNAVLEQLRGGLVVSCQAYPGEPMRDPRVMLAVAQACAVGGAVGIRAQGVDDIRAIGASVDLPLIGLWKDGVDGVFITPTLQHALACAAAGSDIVALDGTRRPRPDGRTLAETIAAFREQCDVAVMADCGSLDDALAAVDAGADCVGTTLAGYTAEREKTAGPDLDLVAQLAARVSVPVLAEGRIQSPAQARLALDAGAFAVVVGTAITHPTSIAQSFATALRH